MSNMSYCRFQNTLGDLQDCFDNWESQTSVEESKAQDDLFLLCRKIAEYYGDFYQHQITSEIPNTQTHKRTVIK